jgi:hypothetical protein
MIRRGASPLGNGESSAASRVDRANDLSLTGWTIIYVTWEDLILRPDEFVTRLLKALAA